MEEKRMKRIRGVFWGWSDLRPRSLGLKNSQFYYLMAVSQNAKELKVQVNLPEIGPLIEVVYKEGT